MIFAFLIKVNWCSLWSDIPCIHKIKQMQFSGFSFRVNAEEDDVCCKIAGRAKELGSPTKEQDTCSCAPYSDFQLCVMRQKSFPSVWALNPKLLSVTTGSWSCQPFSAIWPESLWLIDGHITWELYSNKGPVWAFLLKPLAWHRQQLCWALGMTTSCLGTIWLIPTFSSE